MTNKVSEEMTCFISYSWDSKSHKEWVDRFAESLRDSMIKVIYDNNKDANPIGESVPKFIEYGITSCDSIIIICTENYVQKANDRIGGVGYEIDIISANKLSGTLKKCIPVFRNFNQLPVCINSLHAIDMSNDANYEESVQHILLALNSISPFGEGIAPRSRVFGDDDIPGQLFNVELLSKPIHIKKIRNNFIITVNRGDVRLGIYNITGRDKINKITFPDSSKIETALKLDRDIIHFIETSKDGEELTIEQKNMRWASGAVLSIVNFQNNKWVPFFFRDIPPYGWQLPQGHSEKRNDSLDEPWTFVIREFLEEVIVCSKGPMGKYLRHEFDFDKVDITNQFIKSRGLSSIHDDLRYLRDRIEFKDGDKIHVSFLPTNTQLCVYRDSKHQKDNYDVLVLFNITELGIEVLKILKFELADNQFIMDGEIYEPSNTKQRELLRKPIALISLNYLLKTFGNTGNYQYSFEYDQTMPSIIGSNLQSSDIIIFPQDVIRRRKIADSKDYISNWERKIYQGWFNTFGHFFFDTDGNVSNKNPCYLFTPTAAKVFSQYNHTISNY